MNKNIHIKSYLIAPCGMNCGLCSGHLRDKNQCAGCNSDSLYKPNYCINCPIKNCYMLDSGKSKYCFNCTKYPCVRLKKLDKRYRIKYGMSMIENLNTIQEIGIRKFVKQERQRWICPECGNIICVHKENCLACGAKRVYFYSIGDGIRIR